MRTYRDRFIKNHRKELQFVPGKGQRTVLVYTGDYYTWEPENKSFPTIRRLFVILEILTVILFGLSSIPGTVISYSNFVFIGAIISFVAWFFELFGLYGFCFKKLPLEEDDYAHTKMLNVTCILRAVCLLFSVVSGIIYMSGKGFETTSILAVIGYFITALIAVYLFILYRKTSRYKTVIPGENSQQ